MQTPWKEFVSLLGHVRVVETNGGNECLLNRAWTDPAQEIENRSGLVVGPRSSGTAERLLTDNGPCFVSRELREYLEQGEMRHTRGKPYHPMTQGKIERYHRSLKNVVKLQNYYLPWELEREIERFVRYYNQERVHEALDNLTPADVYEGRGREIQTARERLKQQTLRRRRRYNLGLRVQREEPILPSLYRGVVS